MKSPYYQYPEPYETDDITIVRAVLIDPTHCPKCNTNHSSWAWRDDKDLYCWACGWRESFHFAPSIQRWINECIEKEKRIGEPVLLSDAEEETKRQRRENHAKNRDRDNASALRYQQEHKEELKAKKAEYCRTHRAILRMRSKRYYEEHQEVIKTRRIQKRQLKLDKVRQEVLCLA